MKGVQRVEECKESKSAEGGEGQKVDECRGWIRRLRSADC